MKLNDSLSPNRGKTGMEDGDVSSKKLPRDNLHPQPSPTRSAILEQKSTGQSQSKSDLKDLGGKMHKAILAATNVAKFNTTVVSKRRQKINLNKHTSFYADLDPETCEIASQFGEPIAVIQPGYMLGQFALLNTKPRNASILAIEDCRMMVFHKKEFDHIKQFYNLEFLERRRFLSTIIPTIDDMSDENKKTQFIQYFVPQIFQKGNVLTLEGSVGRNAYFIENGTCGVFKKIHIQNGQKNTSRMVQICTISRGGVFGEECLFGNNRYRYTVKVLTSHLKILLFERTIGIKEFKNYNIFQNLKSMFEVKEQQRLEFLDQAIQQAPEQYGNYRLIERDEKKMGLIQGHLKSLEKKSQKTMKEPSRSKRIILPTKSTKDKMKKVLRITTTLLDLAKQAQFGRSLAPQSTVILPSKIELNPKKKEHDLVTKLSLNTSVIQAKPALHNSAIINHETSIMMSPRQQNHSFLKIGSILGMDRDHVCFEDSQEDNSGMETKISKILTFGESVNQGSKQNTQPLLQKGALSDSEARLTVLSTFFKQEHSEKSFFGPAEKEMLHKVILHFYCEYARLRESASCHKSLQLKNEIQQLRINSLSHPRLQLFIVQYHDEIRQRMQKEFPEYKFRQESSSLDSLIFSVMLDNSSKQIGIKPEQRSDDLKYQYPHNVIYSKKLLDDNSHYTNTQLFGEKQDSLNVNVTQKNFVLQQKKEGISKKLEGRGKTTPSESVIKNQFKSVDFTDCIKNSLQKFTLNHPEENKGSDNTIKQELSVKEQNNSIPQESSHMTIFQDAKWIPVKSQHTRSTRIQSIDFVIKSDLGSQEYSQMISSTFSQRFLREKSEMETTNRQIQSSRETIGTSIRVGPEKPAISLFARKQNVPQNCSSGPSKNTVRSGLLHPSSVKAGQIIEIPTAINRNLVSKQRFRNPFVSNSTQNKHKKHIRQSEELQVDDVVASELTEYSRGTNSAQLELNSMPQTVHKYEKRNSQTINQHRRVQSAFFGTESLEKSAEQSQKSSQPNDNGFKKEFFRQNYTKSMKGRDLLQLKSPLKNSNVPQSQEENINLRYQQDERLTNPQTIKLSHLSEKNGSTPDPYQRILGEKLNDFLFSDLSSVEEKIKITNGLSHLNSKELSKKSQGESLTQSQHSLIVKPETPRKNKNERILALQRPGSSRQFVSSITLLQGLEKLLETKKKPSFTNASVSNKIIIRKPKTKKLARQNSEVQLIFASELLKDLGSSQDQLTSQQIKSKMEVMIRLKVSNC